MLFTLASCGEQKVYHTVKFDYGPNEELKYVRYEYGSLIDIPEEPTKDGYIFVGWFSEKNGEIWNFATDKLTTDVTLKARWQRITKTVTFNSDGGEEFESKEIGVGDLVPKPQNPTKKNHIFKGWFLLDTEWNFEIDRVTEDMTLIAKWEPCPTFTVKFDSAGGGEIPDKYVVLNDLIPPPNDPKRDGYIFMDWTYNGISWNFSTDKVTSDMTLVAQWRIQEKYTITFDTDGGNALTPVVVVEGHKLPAVSDPTKRYYQFDGWFRDGEKINLDTFIPTESLTLKAGWISISNFDFTITFDPDNGDAITTKKMSGYSLITLPQEPQKTGFIFLGWFNGEVKWNFDEDRVEKDTYLKALWTPQTEIKHSVTFDPDNGESPSVVKVIPNDRVTLPDEPKKAGFAFAGWYLGENKWDFAKNAVTSDIVLKAKWVKAYTVTFITDGTSVEPQYIHENKCIKYNDAITTKENYIFDGWYIGDVEWKPYHTVTSDITLTARWREPRVFAVSYIFGTVALLDEAGYLESQPTSVVEGQKLTRPDEPTPKSTALHFIKWEILKINSNGEEYYDNIDLNTFIAVENEMPTDENGDVQIILKAIFEIAFPPVPLAYTD